MKFVSLPHTTRLCQLNLAVFLSTAVILSIVAVRVPAFGFADPAGGNTSRHAKSHGHYNWPDWDQIVRTVTFRDYNTRVVAMGTIVLGIATAMVGVFMLLRRRSLIGDVIGHASLPGITTAFFVLELAYPGSGKSLPALLGGALISGLLGVACTTLILRCTRIKEDAALAIVLSVFFGFGVAMLPVIQRLPTGNAAGLQHFIFGKAASMLARDVQVIGVSAVLIVLICAALFKEFTVLSFDDKFAGTQGWPVVVLDLSLMSLVAAVTVTALQSVGMLLAVAMLVIPAAAARFWTDHLMRMMVIAAILGGCGALLGVIASALFPRLAAGAVIVLCGALLFVVSMLVGKRRGILVRAMRHRHVQARVGHDHLLRAFFEHLEGLGQDGSFGHTLSIARVSRKDLLAARSWRPSELRRLLNHAIRRGLVIAEDADSFRLSDLGASEAKSVVRNHRLWELYLIEYADIAPSHVDRDADDIEHILGPEIIAELEKNLPNRGLPQSPHEIGVDHTHE